ncbi:MAG: RNA pyrophosphohydrolase [Gammaproteobacteria bacterium RIFCSPHIGHO2_12_FULL_35_23]|nr:MAG: RNA pyrophosphohydrolase [Gammaproteobacteria bacterium RIFCSPHIGHO2_12_FULL_35_23]
MIDQRGFRLGVAMIILNSRNRIFWARRIGGNGWQFPQGGLLDDEPTLDAMYRELYEEVGLVQADVEIVAESKCWLYYYLPRHLVRRNTQPLCIGQKQKWYLLRLKNDQAEFDFATAELPEFDDYRWVSYWYPLKQVIFFKRKLYQRILHEFAPLVFESKVT